MVDDKWKHIPYYICWNCGERIGRHKESNRTSECYCFPCLITLIQANAGGENIYKVLGVDMATDKQVLALLDVMTEIGYFLNQGDTDIAKIIVDFTLHENGLTYDGHDDKPEGNITPIR